jgi:UDP-glucose 4-epimerase
MSTMVIQSKNEIIIFDNLPRDKRYNYCDRSNLYFIQVDMLDPISLQKAIDKCHIVFHLAANLAVAPGSIDTKMDYK